MGEWGDDISIVNIRVHVCINNAGDDLVFAWVVNVIKVKLLLKRMSNYFSFVCIAESNTSGAIKGGNRGGFLPESFRNSPKGNCPQHSG
ncbi:hypothetical protein TNCV_1712371 [Trichonephila clavipes]|nr:hypothetical protein TNCV_1712371 [Trichonephila clavipes]